jgi:hypothetical protein
MFLPYQEMISSLLNLISMKEKNKNDYSSFLRRLHILVEHAVNIHMLLYHIKKLLNKYSNCQLRSSV